MMKKPDESKRLDDALGIGIPAGGPHYRAYVGPPKDYDLIAAMSFNLLTTLGLRQHHRLLDVGCGSLRVGRLLIPYLNCGHYTGLEPNSWLIENGVQKETGRDQIRQKQANLIISDSPDSLETGPYFDYALAQSIFSHCGLDLMQTWLNGVSKRLKQSGALVATVILSKDGFTGSGWSYPGVVSHTWGTVSVSAEEAGFHVQLLDWAHPRQSWVLFSKPRFNSSWIDKGGLTWNSWMKRKANR